MVAINHRRAQILAPHREVDPWAGLDRSRRAEPRRADGRGSGSAPSSVWPEDATPRTGPSSAWPEATRRPSVDRPPELAIDRQVQAVAPLGPAAVVDRDVLVAEQRQHERELRGRDPRAVVADHPPAAGDVRLEQQVAQLVADREVLAAGLASWPPTGTLTAPGMWPSRFVLPS